MAGSLKKIPAFEVTAFEGTTLAVPGAGKESYIYEGSSDSLKAHLILGKATLEHSSSYMDSSAQAPGWVGVLYLERIPSSPKVHLIH